MGGDVWGVEVLAGDCWPEVEIEIVEVDLEIYGDGSFLDRGCFLLGSCWLYRLFLFCVALR